MHFFGLVQGEVDSPAVIPANPAATVAKGYWENKSGWQIAIIVGLALLVIVSAAGLSAAAKEHSTEQSAWDDIKALVVDPKGGLAATSGAIFYAALAVMAVGLWALLDNKENRFAQWIKSLFINKIPGDKLIIGMATGITLLAMPFILLAAQGCEPFSQGWEQFKKVMVGSTNDPLAASTTAISWYGLAGLFSVVGVCLFKNSKVEERNEEDKGRIASWWEPKSSAQQKCLYALLAVALITPFFIITSALGAEPCNLKQIITDHTSSVSQGIAAAGILVGLGLLTVTSLWSIYHDEASSKAFFSKWDGEKNTWRRRIGITMTALFVLAIPLIIMTVKGTEPFAGEFSHFTQWMEENINYGAPLLFGGLLTITALTMWALFPDRETELERYDREELVKAKEVYLEEERGAKVLETRWAGTEALVDHNVARWTVEQGETALSREGARNKFAEPRVSGKDRLATTEEVATIAFEARAAKMDRRAQQKAERGAETSDERRREALRASYGVDGYQDQSSKWKLFGKKRVTLPTKAASAPPVKRAPEAPRTGGLLDDQLGE